MNVIRPPTFPTHIDYQFLMPSGYYVSIYGFRTACPTTYWLQISKQNPLTDQSYLEYQRYISESQLWELLSLYQQRCLWSSHQLVGPYILPRLRPSSSNLSEYSTSKKYKI